MNRYESDKKINMIVMTGLMMCLILVATSLFKVPVPFTQGYVHLGDAMIFLSVLVLGKKNGAIAAGFGSALGDILGGYAMWAPWTFVIKFAMAFVMGIFVEAMEKRGHKTGNKGVCLIEVLGMILGGAEMAGGYFIAERFIYGNWTVAALAIPWNIGQFTVGMIVATVLAAALYKTPAKKFFAIKN
ncbi:ECF transporter S component [Aminicella lysinilytica]|uniref:Putative membrane protein n=1 Tax=Aminicella lysinilytica TaxID=433323 RepID=A0A4R6QE51_9FIRM|nr:ECF transporter S component [Aminicella lysinilytica]TDP60497.1 putative membrane protein [Aminicella lysinilytica]